MPASTRRPIYIYCIYIYMYICKYAHMYICMKSTDVCIWLCIYICIYIYIVICKTCAYTVYTQTCRITYIHIRADLIEVANIIGNKRLTHCQNYQKFLSIRVLSWKRSCETAMPWVSLRTSPKKKGPRHGKFYSALEESPLRKGN